MFKAIFVNSFIYKFIALVINMYKHSRLKVLCDNIVNISKESKIAKSVVKFVNSQPRYKSSLLLEINEKIYNFIVTHSKGLYDFVDKTFSGSIVVCKVKESFESSKNSKAQSTCLFILCFVLAYICATIIMRRTLNIGILYYVLGIFVTLLYFLSDYIVKAFYSSFCYKTVNRLLELEVAKND
ncbi:MAG: hypothetical protein ACK5LV_05955 [Lachnospirales bacterium]